MDAEERDALFERILSGDWNSEGVCKALHSLRIDATQQTFDRAMEWTYSGDARRRARAVDVLSQMYRRKQGTVLGEHVFREESYPRIAEMMDREQDKEVLLSCIHGLGYLGNANAAPLISPYKDHDDPGLRYAAACALAYLQEHPEAVSALLQLCNDVDAEVRDWAVFGLGVQGDADSEEIRNTLVKCLEDENEDVREEAAAGLGKRQDVRLLPVLWNMLNEPELTMRVYEAAAGMLGFDMEIKGWNADDYIAALRGKFPEFGK